MSRRACDLVASLLRTKALFVLSMHLPKSGCVRTLYMESVTRRSRFKRLLGALATASEAVPVAQRGALRLTMLNVLSLAAGRVPHEVPVTAVRRFVDRSASEDDIIALFDRTVAYVEADYETAA